MHFGTLMDLKIDQPSSSHCLGRIFFCLLFQTVFLVNLLGRFLEHCMLLPPQSKPSVIMQVFCPFVKKISIFIVADRLLHYLSYPVVSICQISQRVIQVFKSFGGFLLYAYFVNMFKHPCSSIIFLFSMGWGQGWGSIGVHQRLVEFFLLDYWRLADDCYYFCCLHRSKY